MSNIISDYTHSNCKRRSKRERLPETCKMCKYYNIKCRCHKKGEVWLAICRENPDPEARIPEYCPDYESDNSSETSSVSDAFWDDDAFYEARSSHFKKEPHGPRCKPLKSCLKKPRNESSYSASRDSRRSRHYSHYLAPDSPTLSASSSASSSRSCSPDCKSYRRQNYVRYYRDLDYDSGSDDYDFPPLSAEVQSIANTRLPSQVYGMLDYGRDSRKVNGFHVTEVNGRRLEPEIEVPRRRSRERSESSSRVTRVHIKLGPRLYV